MFRQGDVLIVPTTEVTGKIQRKKSGKTILALGEVTRHHHRFETEHVKMFKDEGGSFGRVSIDVQKPSDLVHEEHSAITVPKGKYQQAFQVEYTPKEIRRVAD